jgi:hypothetical protein
MDKDRINNVAKEIDSFSSAEYVSLATTIKQDDVLIIFDGDKVTHSGMSVIGGSNNIDTFRLSVLSDFPNKCGK